MGNAVSIHGLVCNMQPATTAAKNNVVSPMCCFPARVESRCGSSQQGRRHRTSFPKCYLILISIPK
ncbi:unnamed protein product [Cyprideis torosa]|uniref:Uncharacterized protein n=1 Tax=Cyprideis torosa TaxID=163714 RepID=A0A7R8ZV15_9CRUS|nr:unnamed protein product [Cyprideis torosa]CAG0901533.1 unnamed protein product [Cyprideis torosa]